MKTLLKTLFLIIVLSIFLFSNNKTISSTRKFCAENGKALYQKGTKALSESKVKFLASTGNFIK
jgi:hypothetical protein